MKQVAIFASGAGSNARRIMEHFRDSGQVRVCLVVSNKDDAPVLETARRFGVETLLIDRADFYGNEVILDVLRSRNVDLIVLAGFLWLVPPYLVHGFPKGIVNIHPALLPKFGGKGMYGMRVHEAVKAAGEMETGITIHYVDERYDEGQIIFQARCTIAPEDSPRQIAERVQKLEHFHFPVVLEQLLCEMNVIGAENAD